MIHLIYLFLYIVTASTDADYVKFVRYKLKVSHIYHVYKVLTYKVYEFVDIYFTYLVSYHHQTES